MRSHQRATDAGDQSQADARFGLRVVLSLVALVLIAVPFGLLLFLVRGEWHPLVAVDTGARDELNAFAVDNSVFVIAMKAVSWLGSAPVYAVVFAGIAGWLWRRGMPRLGVFVVVTLLGSWALNAAVKQAVDRARPALPEPVASAPGLSFPSGHAQSAVVTAAVLLLVFLPVMSRIQRRVAVSVAAAMVLAIGFSRVALGVHYVSDVLAGYVLGAAWVAAMSAMFRTWQVERRQALRAAQGARSP